MKIYISGKMTGIKDFNRPYFFNVERKLSALGYTVINPACLPISKEIKHAEYITINIAMLSICDAICMLDGWRESKGANIEHEAALMSGKIMFYGEKGLARVER